MHDFYRLDALPMAPPTVSKHCIPILGDGKRRCKMREEKKTLFGGKYRHGK